MKESELLDNTSYYTSCGLIMTGRQIKYYNANGALSYTAICPV